MSRREVFANGIGAWRDWPVAYHESFHDAASRSVTRRALFFQGEAMQFATLPRLVMSSITAIAFCISIEGCVTDDVAEGVTLAIVNASAKPPCGGQTFGPCSQAHRICQRKNGAYQCLPHCDEKCTEDDGAIRQIPGSDDPPECIEVICVNCKQQKDGNGATTVTCDE